MAVAQRVSQSKKYAEILDFFTSEEVQNNLTFLMLVDYIIQRGIEPDDQGIITITDPQDQTNVLYYTKDKFIEIFEEYGLDGFIY